MSRRSRSAKAFRDARRADRRRQILHLLHVAGGQFCASELTLKPGLEDLGHGVGSDRLRTDLAWLADQDLVELRDVDDIAFATLTVAGQAALAGRIAVPGVRPPTPAEL